MNSLSVVILYHEDQQNKSDRSNQREKLIRLIGLIPDFVNEILIVNDHGQGTPFFHNFHRQELRILNHPLQENFAQQRNWALRQIKSEWTLFLDSDEVPSRNFLNEVKLALNQDQPKIAFRLHRRTVLFNYPLQRAEGAHQFPVRLALTNVGQDKWQRQVHEVWNLPVSNNQIGIITAPVWHQTTDSLSRFVAKLNRYSRIEAQLRPKPNQIILIFQALIYPSGKFLYNYLFKLGFIDGWRGLLITFLMSYHSLSTRIFLYERFFANHDRS